MSSSESAEPAGWLRLGDLAIGDSGVCVTSLIKDKIREYMLNEEQQQHHQHHHQQRQQQHTVCTTTGSTAAAAVTTVTTANAGRIHATAGDGAAADDVGGTCVRRIGNSLDLLLRESRNAGRAVAAGKHRSSSAPAVAAADDCTVSTTIGEGADSIRPTADGPELPPPPPTYAFKR